MRRSSRSVCTNIAEAYRKRRYRNHFISKLSDADSENSETGVWMDFCLELKLINNLQYEAMTTLNKEVGRILAFMINHPERFGV
jgi:four helix bundle protein